MVKSPAAIHTDIDVAWPSEITSSLTVDAFISFLDPLIPIASQRDYSFVIPKVLAYSTSSTHPVGAEDIIMERIEGVSLASRWLFYSIISCIIGGISAYCIHSDSDAGDSLDYAQ
ncbi:hypothetical protein P175DRAFT_0534079 [Aspergillus ochraceoroseus IBT 24754]|uniref:Uncharacterized protein n=1 Tax=Aspergillus ochraceoroseus IBT 24754 TaxID=1392256 RepID=A0A2T5LTM4_9EURO|nr:uncharacterized protein P175DRAFT_0534079 [Aspergillus ochraceoroseus IBT 24754]PTU19632.1 hypothetical protein P175DRAFT_0534079 [Aspergillus ochraceoroseus IBT 24754]